MVAAFPSALPVVQQLLDPSSPRGTETSWIFCLLGGLVTTVLCQVQEKFEIYNFEYDRDFWH